MRRNLTTDRKYDRTGTRRQSQQTSPDQASDDDEPGTVQTKQSQSQHDNADEEQFHKDGGSTQDEIWLTSAKGPKKSAAESLAQLIQTAGVSVQDPHPYNSSADKSTREPSPHAPPASSSWESLPRLRRPSVISRPLRPSTNTYLPPSLPKVSSNRNRFSHESNRVAKRYDLRHQPNSRSAIRSGQHQQQQPLLHTPSRTGTPTQVNKDARQVLLARPPGAITGPMSLSTCFDSSSEHSLISNTAVSRLNLMTLKYDPSMHLSLMTSFGTVEPHASVAIELDAPWLENGDLGKCHVTVAPDNILELRGIEFLAGRKVIKMLKAKEHELEERKAAVGLGYESAILGPSQPFINRPRYFDANQPSHPPEYPRTMGEDQPIENDESELESDSLNDYFTSMYDPESTKRERTPENETFDSSQPPAKRMRPSRLQTHEEHFYPPHISRPSLPSLQKADAWAIALNKDVGIRVPNAPISPRYLETHYDTKSDSSLIATSVAIRLDVPILPRPPAENRVLETDFGIIMPTEIVVLDIEADHSEAKFLERCNIGVAPTDFLESNGVEFLAGKKMVERLRGEKGSPVEAQDSLAHRESSPRSAVPGPGGWQERGRIEYPYREEPPLYPTGSNSDSIPYPSSSVDDIHSESRSGSMSPQMVIEQVYSEAGQARPVIPVPNPSPISSLSGSRLVTPVRDPSPEIPAGQGLAKSLILGPIHGPPHPEPQAMDITSKSHPASGTSYEETDPLLEAAEGSHDLIRIVSELRHSRPTSINLEMRSEVTLADMFRLGMEDLTRSRWNWWPLSAPRRPFGDHEVRLAWICSCGENRSENVPLMFGLKVYETVIQRVAAGGASSSLGTRAMALDHNQRSFSASTPLGSSIQLGVGNTSESSFGAIESAGDNNKTPGHTQIEQQREKHIFLLGGLPDSLKLQQMSSTQQCTLTFANDLRRGYREVRGFWRFWFSIYNFSHCDFFEFERFCLSGFSSRGPGLPPNQQPYDKDYFYNPRPALCNPPISPEEFRHIYHHYKPTSVVEFDIWNKPFFVITHPNGFWPRLCRDVPPLFRRHADGDFPTDTVPRIPQRYTRFDELRSERESLWGLRAQEEISAVKVSVYIMLSMAPSFAFCFVYLFGIGGESVDLQNATTLLTISLTTMGLFIAWLVTQNRGIQ